MTILEAKKFGKSTLTKSPSAVLDTEVLLKAVLDKDKTYLLFNPQQELSPEEEERFRAYLNMRQTGLPVAYILGHKEFFAYDFVVTPDVLIPKADTEILVEKGFEVLEDKCQSNHILTILDMCTGSGCVGISLYKYAVENHLFKKENAPLLILADISDKALEIAGRNVERLLPEFSHRISLVRTNLFQMIAGSFDLILSNPPYIPSVEARALLSDGRNEPLLALDGDIDLKGNNTNDNDGLGIMRNLVPQAYNFLAPKGVLLCESGEYNAEMTQYLFQQAGLKNTEIFTDLEGQLRVTKGIKP